jgi:hypothetical protein
MPRPDFRRWDAELRPGELAEALAAAGVLCDRRIPYPFPADEVFLASAIRAAAEGEFLRWREPNFLESSDGDRHVPPTVLAAAWRAAVDYENPPRFRIWARPERAAWYARQLTDLSWKVSVSLVPDTLSPLLDWNWPIRIGVAAGRFSKDLESSLRELLNAEKRWLDPLVRFIDMDSSDATADLLLVADGLAVRSTLENSLTAIRANCLFLTGAGPGLWEYLSEDIIRGVELTLASGAILAAVDPMNPRRWLGALVRELSHNVPIDRAVRRVNVDAFLTASDSLLNGTLLPAAVERISRRAERSAQTLEVDEEMSRHLDLPAGSYPLRHVGEHLRKNLDRFRYEHETDEATTISRLWQATEGESAIAEEGEPETRYLQHRISDARPRERPRPAPEWLEAGELYDLFVRIGSPEEGWRDAHEPFPEALLPPTDAGGHLLTIVFSEPNSVARPMVSSDGAIFGHPDRTTVARVLLAAPRAELCFNYLSDDNRIWCRPETQRRFRYTARFPTTAGLRVELA